jgi:hypothetical protein
MKNGSVALLTERVARVVYKFPGSGTTLTIVTLPCHTMPLGNKCYLENHCPAAELAKGQNCGSWDRRCWYTNPLQGKPTVTLRPQNMFSRKCFSHVNLFTRL